MRLPALHGFHFQVQLYPVKLAVAGIRVDAHDTPFEPTLALPEFGVEVDLNTVTDADGICHAQ